MHVGRRRSKSIARPSNCGQQPVGTSQRSCSFPLQTCQHVAVRLAFRNVSYPNPVVFTSNTRRTRRSGEMIAMAVVLTTSHFFSFLFFFGGGGVGRGVGVGGGKGGVQLYKLLLCLKFFCELDVSPLKIAWYPPSCHPFLKRVRILREGTQLTFWCSQMTGK